MGKDIQVGDRVRFMDDVGEGVVVEVLLGDKIKVEDEDGFDREYHRKELVVVGDRASEEEAYWNKLPSLSDILAKDVDENKQKKICETFEVKYANARATSQHRRGEHMEVDLHFHELVEDMSMLKDRVFLDVQLNHFERMMRIASEQRIRKIIFIHGVGQGVLRNQIRNRLDLYYPDCSARDANPREYGAGATEITLGQSAF